MLRGRGRAGDDDPPHPLHARSIDPEYETIAEWLTGKAERPKVEGLTDAALDRAMAFYRRHPLDPGRAGDARGCAGRTSSRAGSGARSRSTSGLVDEASMLDERQFDDLREIFPTLVLFGDPAQLAPVGQAGGDGVRHAARGAARADAAPASTGRTPTARSSTSPMRSATRRSSSTTSRRWSATPRARDERVVWAERVDSDVMARAPVLVWRNATRIRLISAFRAAHGAPPDALLPGEPLICDGIELPLKHRKKRIDLEARGLIKGAQVIYLGPGQRDRASRGCTWSAPRSRRSRRRQHHQDRDAGRGGAVHPRRPRRWARSSCTARR